MAKKIREFRRYIYILLVGFIAFTLTVCSSPQVKPWDNTAQEQIKFNFIDTDEDEGEIGGDITLDLPSSLKPAGVVGYVVYWGDTPDAEGKTTQLTEVPAAQFTGSVLYTVPENTKISGQYFLLFLKGEKDAEIFSGKATQVNDKFEGVEVPEESDVTKAAPVEEPEEEVAADQPVDALQADVPTPSVATPDASTPEVSAPTSTQVQVDTQRQAEVDIYTLVIENVLFEFDKSYVSSEFREQLQNDFAGVQNKEHVSILIAGHADERGSNEYNLALGERRAFAVKRYLISMGFQADNIRIISYGEEKPVDPGHNEAAWAKNRRAETEIAD